jgi:hypothetical protein
MIFFNFMQVTGMEGFEPPISGSKPDGLTTCRHPKKCAEAVGFEPTNHISMTTV